jgi:stage V sporulation protein G
MKITSCQVYVMKEHAGKTRATARCMLDDEFQCTGIRIVDGANGLFVTFPNDPSYKGDDYRQLYYPVSKELRSHIEDTLLAKYEEETLQSDTKVSLEVYHFLLKQDWLTKQEREYAQMLLNSFGAPNIASRVESNIKACLKDLKDLRKKQRLLSKGLGETLKTKLTDRYGNKAPKMLDHDFKDHRAVAQCVLKDLTL